MRRLTIGLDLDSCMSYFLESFLQKYNYFYADDLEPKDITSWNLAQFLKCSEEEMHNLWNSNFIFNVPVRDGARKLIEDIKERGHDVYIVTSYGRAMCEDKVNWCEKFLGLNEEEVIFIRNKSLLKIDVLLDDYVENFKDKHGLPINGLEKIIFTQPYNKDVKDIGWHYRVEKLNEVIGIIDIISKK